VVEANEKLYVNREEGFIGTSLKKDEYVCNCSDIDDVIIFFKDGKYKIVKVAEKLFVGKNILHLDVFRKNDKRTVYNTVYRDGKLGPYYIKRFSVNGITRDKEYDITQGTAGSKIIYFTSNPNAEAEVIRVTLKPKPRITKLIFEKDFSEIAIKGRQSMGNILTKNDIHKIALKQKGGSTLGGRQVWFDRDVLRLNYDKRGEYLGEFHSEDLILIISSKGDYYTSNFDLSNHYEKDIQVIEKFNPNKVWSLVLFDAEQQFYYLKRFQLEASQKNQSLLGENSDSKMIALSAQDYPRFKVEMGGNDSYREALEVDAEEFIGVKSFKAKGKRLTTFEVAQITELEPLRFNEVEEPENEGDENIIQNEDVMIDEDENGEVSEADSTENSSSAEEPDSSELSESTKTDEPSESEDVKPQQPAPVKRKQKRIEPESNEEEEIIDQRKIIDEITGQMTLF
jgi:topoisomerase-4 subunit A